MQQGVMWNRFDSFGANCFGVPNTTADQHAVQDIVSSRGRGASSWTAAEPEAPQELETRRDAAAFPLAERGLETGKAAKCHR